MQRNTNSLNCKRLSPGSAGKSSTIQPHCDSARISEVIHKRDRRMRSLISRVPQRLARSIEGDEEVVMMFLKELWPRIVGEELARNTEPAGFREQVLRVQVPSVLWSSQLAGLRTMMIRSINRFWGAQLVESIEWEVDLSAASRDF